MKKENDGYPSLKQFSLILVVLFLFYLAFAPRGLQLDSDLQKVQVLTLENEGYHRINVLGTGSMEPLIPRGGAKVIVKRVDSIDELRIGNVLVYTTEYRKRGVAHRLISIKNETLEMKGDSTDEIEEVDFYDGILKVYSVVRL